MIVYLACAQLTETYIGHYTVTD